MSNQEYRYTLHAVVRTDEGKGASRRLRREGWVPAIVYGGNADPKSIAIKQDELQKNAKHDSFFSQIINLKIEGEEEQEILVRDVQHHVYKPLFQHFDFQRIVRGQELHASVALHFINDEKIPGVVAGGVLSRILTSLDVVCRPRHLPEYIEVDVGNLEVGESITAKDIKFPEGVRVAGELSEEELSQLVIASILRPAGGASSTSAEEEAADADDAE